jgi:23S rRNA (guanosine2251-2'-O)-methyltransferase
MKALQQDGLWLSGLEAVPDAGSFTEADLTGPVGLVVGGEGPGLGRLVRETCDFLIRLPMYGKVSSLNAGVAAGIVLYEAVRQRLKAGVMPV